MRSGARRIVGVLRGTSSRATTFAALACVLAAPTGSRAAETGGLWDKVLETLDMKTTPGPMPDFVQSTRPNPASLRYIPTGQPHPKRSEKVKSAGEVEAAKQALDAAAAAQLLPRPAPAKPPVAIDKGAAKKVAARPGKPGAGKAPPEPSATGAPPDAASTATGGD